MKETGIKIIGKVPWGTHFCQFYQTSEDLLTILVPYIKTGLEQNEYCMWVTSEPLTAEQAVAALHDAIPDLNTYIARGQIEILDYNEWYTLGGKLDTTRVLKEWFEREGKALQAGYNGLRVMGNTFLLEKENRDNPTEYEHQINKIFGNHRIIALCTYRLDRCRALELLDMVKNHQFAIFKRGNTWEVIQDKQYEKIGHLKVLIEDRTGDLLDKKSQLIIEIAERKQVEADLKTLATLPDENPDPILRVSSDNTILYANPASKNLLATWALEIGKKLPQILLDSIPNDIGENISITVEVPVDNLIFSFEIVPVGGMDYRNIYGRNITKRKQMEEALLQHRDHLEQLVKDRTSELKARNEKLSEEITKRQQVIEELAESERKFHTLADFTYDWEQWNAPDGSAIYNTPACERITGYRPEDFYNNPELITAIMHPEDRPLNGYHFKHIDEGNPTIVEFRIITRKGDVRWIEHGCQAVYGENGRWLGRRGSNRDISQRKRAEEKMREAMNVAEASNTAKSDFLANMSHELRTPLNAIIGFSQVLRDKVPGPLTPEQEEILGDILQSGQHLASVIGDILDVTQIEAGKLELQISEFAIKNVLTYSTHVFQDQTKERSIQLSLDVPDDIGTITADERRVTQVVINLLSNAIKFTPKGGQAGIIARRDGSNVQVTVWDTGIGIAPENMDKLFRQFQRLATSLTDNIPGTGLGLNFSKKIVELHGGRMWVESQLGKGSKFIFSIPIRTAV